MTLEELIKELTTIWAAYPGSGDWQVVGLDGPVGSDDYFNFSTALAVPALNEVRLT